MLRILSGARVVAVTLFVMALTVLSGVSGWSCSPAARRVETAVRPGGDYSQPGRPFDAKGRAPQADKQWKLRRSDGDYINLFTALARCGNEMFVTDNQNRLLGFDAGADGLLREIANESDGLGRPNALAPDCANQRLHIVNDGPSTVTTLDVKSASVVKTQTFPLTLRRALSAHVGSPDRLNIASLWNPEPSQDPLGNRTIENFYDQLHLGGSVSLSTGVAEPLLPPYERRCIGAGACLATDLDSFPPSKDARLPVRVASQAASDRIGLYDRQNRIVRTVTVTSPMFRRDGDKLPVSPRSQPRLLWMTRNSIIRRVFAFADVVAVVHSRTDPAADPQGGEPGRLHVFLNLYSRRGDSLVNDIGIPDIPLGRDGAHLYVVEHGSAGRQLYTKSVTLLQISIESLTRIGTQRQND